MTQQRGWSRLDRGQKQTVWSTMYLLFAISVIIYYLLTGPGVFPHSHGGLVLLVVLVLMIASAVPLRDKAGGAWLVGLLLVAAVPIVLSLALSIIEEGDTREGIRGMIYLYVAGSFGGLVLELLQNSSHSIELPYVVKPDPTASVSGGPVWCLGFLSKLIVGGLAGLALVTVVGTVADPEFLFTADQADPTKPEGLVWALVAGSVAPAVWKKLGQA
jgi:predicted outer membrane lipoprotein